MSIMSIRQSRTAPPPRQHQANVNGQYGVVNDDTADLLPPQNLEAERSVLGSILLDNGVLPAVLKILTVDDFYRADYQDYFRAICHLHEQGQPADSVTVPDELGRRDLFTKIGGHDTLRQIIDSVPHAVNAAYYADIVRQKSILRRAIDAAAAVIRDGYSHLFTAEALADRAFRDFQEIAALATELARAKLTVCAEDVEEEPVDYLWLDRIARAFLSLFAGQTSLGKTWVMLDVVARLTTGKALPGTEEVHDAISVLIISEDSQAKVLKPRLRKLGADLKRVHFMTWEGMQGYTLDNAAYLERAWKEAGEPDLIIIDPPSNFTGDYNEYVNSEVRKMLDPITRWLAKHATVACVLITHVNKNITQGLDALDRVMGSVAWQSTPRIVLGFVRDPQDAARCICGGLKNNLGDKASSLSYSLSKALSPDKVQWHGVSQTSADDALAKKPVTRTVVAWLEDRFREKREWPSDVIVPMGVAAGFSFNALVKSKEVKALPIRRQPVREPDGSVAAWLWIAKPDWPPPPPGG
jgi:hypothetical protein